MLEKEKLELIQNDLSDILVMLRDNPEDKTNTQLFLEVYCIIQQAKRLMESDDA